MINTLEELKEKLKFAYSNAKDTVDKTRLIMQHVDKEYPSALLVANIGTQGMVSILKIVLEDLGETVDE